jgi:hypothetical protein
MYRFPRSLIVTSLLYVVPEADAKQVGAAPNMPTSLYTYRGMRHTSMVLYFYGASKKTLHKPRVTLEICYLKEVVVLIIIYNFYVNSFSLKLT